MIIQMKQEEDGSMQGHRRLRGNDCSVFRSGPLPYVAVTKLIYFSVFSVTEGKLVPMYLVRISVSLVFSSIARCKSGRPYKKAKLLVNSRRRFSTCSNFDYLMK